MQQLKICYEGFSHLKENIAIPAEGRILLVTGAHIRNYAARTMLANFPKAVVAVTETPRGLLEKSLLKQEAERIDRKDTIIAIGGGSTIDYAKGLLYYLPDKAKQPFFLAIPTTAGSGSEATDFAVVYEKGVKASLVKPSLLPNAVLLDASLLEGLSCRQKVISGSDAIAQCIESLWNKFATEESKAFAGRGLKLLWNMLPHFAGSDDPELAEKMLEGAHLSGKAIAITKTTGPHALSYFLTSRLGVPHGQAVACFLPLFFLYNFGVGEDHSTASDIIFQLIGAEKPAEGFPILHRFFAALDLPITLSELGVEREMIPELVRSVNLERFANNPVAFDADRLENLILQYCFTDVSLL
ncbi:MAG: hypothetical protein JWP88_961 [Flaviaesturariibacter sp.]|nr:hypothetical protein [Flaviaesturariibacter sp.]